MSNKYDGPFRIAIVGGGIAGLALAVPLAEQESGQYIDVHLYEAAASFAEIGAGVAFGPNAIRVMRHLGVACAFNSYAAVPPGAANKWFDVRQSDPNLYPAHNLITIIDGENAGGGSVYRADLLDELIALYPKEKVSFGKRCLKYTEKTADEPITLFFEDGTTAEADVLIGCDGVKSHIRQCMFADAPEGASKQKYSGWIAYRGVVPRAAVTEALGVDVEDSIAVMPTLWTGQDRHILHFPIRYGAQVNVVGFVLDREGVRAAGRDGPWTEEVSPNELQDAYSAFNSGCLGILKAIEKPTIRGIFDIPALPTYVKGRVALCGDSVSTAHAMTPHQGSGAGQAIEDAYILNNLLRSAAICSLYPNRSAKNALEAYDCVRRPRANAVQRTSAEAGLLYEYALPGAGADAQSVRERLEHRMNWIWEWDEEGALREAVRLFHGLEVDFEGDWTRWEIQADPRS